MAKRNTLIILSGLALILAACDYELQGGSDETDGPAFVEPEEPKQIRAIPNQTGIITILPSVTENSLTLKVSGAPDGADLECHLNQMPLVPCADNAVFIRPAIGTYKITAAALDGDRIVALGESKSFEVVGNDQTGTGEEDLQLLLVPQNENFELYQPHDLTTPFVALFDFEETPACDAILKCAFGATNTQFWGQCDAGDTSFTVTPEMLALDAQTVKVRAQCGDVIGPELHFPINGVPAGYEPLMLFERVDGKGRHLFELVSQADCQEEADLIHFECRAPGSEYARCDNSQTNPVTGTEIRIVCGDKVGPPLLMP